MTLCPLESGQGILLDKQYGLWSSKGTQCPFLGTSIKDIQEKVVFFFFKDLFIYDRHRERERGRDTGGGRSRLHAGRRRGT